MKKLNIFQKILAVLVLSAIAIGFIACDTNISKSDIKNPLVVTQENESNSSISDSVWELVSHDESVLEKKMIVNNGRLYSFSADYSNVYGDANVESLNEECMTILAQWALSALTFDFSLHVPLFQKELIEEEIYTVFADEGFSPEDGIKKISNDAYELFPYETVRIEYKISEVKYNDNNVIEELINYNGFFEKFGLDINKLSDVIEYTIADSRIIFDDFLYYSFFTDGDGFDGDVIIYKYDGKWYLHFSNLDNDLSIDILQSEKEKNDGFFTSDSTCGKITSIDKDYICLDEKKYFSVKNYNSDINVSVGDFVEIQHYQQTMQFNKLSDDTECTFDVAISIEKKECYYHYN
ncbi:MAG: hypothetical protein IJZ94_03195 [Clostridia bacterium]|nr:hypothetical protein [Clostridia bacterium]